MLIIATNLTGRFPGQRWAGRNLLKVDRWTVVGSMTAITGGFQIFVKISHKVIVLHLLDVQNVADLHQAVAKAVGFGAETPYKLTANGREIRQNGKLVVNLGIALGTTIDCQLLLQGGSKCYGISVDEKKQTKTFVKILLFAGWSAKEKNDLRSKEIGSYKSLRIFFVFLIFDDTEELKMQLEANYQEMSDLKKELEAKNTEKNEQYERKIG